jgi:hypothetical protein
MSIIKLGCGCKYNLRTKTVIWYFRQHLNAKIQSNINTQNQINAGIIQRQALQQEQKRNTFHQKPLFSKDKRYFKKLKLEYKQHSS